MSALTRSVTLAASLLLASSLALAQAQKIVPAQSEIGFTSKQMGVPVDGKFRKWDAQISFDPKKPEAGSVNFTIDTGSAGFGSPETDAEVPKPVWFNVAKFPQATFQSSSLKALGGGKFEVAGKLTIKGNVKDVVVPVALAQSAGGVTVATGAFTIKRLDFKIGEGEWADTSMVANDVQVKFKLAVTGVAPL
ncbi:MAG TPA: YceI family protein [Ideonella sp.]|uniref:YceI family protein n=1 Tax=Ideonella sp. TaxID=1929293 RepID=UPI002E30621B|nr:YceI family protein [Ideonella sp.]HEX5682531.1 YceI family protein [Ideonella sp.]